MQYEISEIRQVIDRRERGGNLVCGEVCSIMRCLLNHCRGLLSQSCTIIVQDMKDDLAWSLLCGLRDGVMYRKAVARSFMLLTKSRQPVTWAQTRRNYFVPSKTEQHQLSH